MIMVEFLKIVWQFAEQRIANTECDEYPGRMTHTDSSTALRLVGYRRVSTREQLDGFGLEAQTDAVEQWARRAGHTVVEWCEDAGKSGTLPATDRPGLMRVIDAVKRREVDGLVCARLDRLARELTVQESVLAVLWKAGGRLFTVDNGELVVDDPDDPMRTAMRQMMGVFAQLDRAMTISRMRAGKRAKAAAGKHVEGSYPYGWHGVDDVAAPHDDEQRGVELIRSMRADGHTARAIVAALDNAGIKPRRAERWSHQTVLNIAKRA